MGGTLFVRLPLRSALFALASVFCTRVRGEPPPGAAARYRCPVTYSLAYDGGGGGGGQGRFFCEERFEPQLSCPIGFVALPASQECTRSVIVLPELRCPEGVLDPAHRTCRIVREPDDACPPGFRRAGRGGDEAAEPVCANVVLKEQTPECPEGFALEKETGTCEAEVVQPPEALCPTGFELEREEEGDLSGGGSNAGRSATAGAPAAASGSGAVSECVKVMTSRLRCPADSELFYDSIDVAEDGDGGTGSEPTSSAFCRRVLPEAAELRCPPGAEKAGGGEDAAEAEGGGEAGAGENDAAGAAGSPAAGCVVRSSLAPTATCPPGFAPINHQCRRFELQATVAAAEALGRAPAPVRTWLCPPGFALSREGGAAQCVLADDALPGHEAEALGAAAGGPAAVSVKPVAVCPPYYIYSSFGFCMWGEKGEAPLSRTYSFCAPGAGAGGAGAGDDAPPCLRVSSVPVSRECPPAHTLRGDACVREDFVSAVRACAAAGARIEDGDRCVEVVRATGGERIIVRIPPTYRCVDEEAVLVGGGDGEAGGGGSGVSGARDEMDGAPASGEGAAGEGAAGEGAAGGADFPACLTVRRVERPWLCPESATDLGDGTCLVELPAPEALAPTEKVVPAVKSCQPGTVRETADRCFVVHRRRPDLACPPDAVVVEEETGGEARKLCARRIAAAYVAPKPAAPAAAAVPPPVPSVNRPLFASNYLSRYPQLYG